MTSAESPPTRNPISFGRVFLCVRVPYTSDKKVDTNPNNNDSSPLAGQWSEEEVSIYSFSKKISHHI